MTDEFDELEVEKAPSAPRNKRKSDESKKSRKKDEVEPTLIVPKKVPKLIVDIEKPHPNAIVWIHFSNGKESLVQMLKCLKNNKLQGKDKENQPVFEIVIPNITNTPNENNNHFSGLRVQDQDKASCCMVVANLKAKVHFTDEYDNDDESMKYFRLSTTRLDLVIRTIDSSHSSLVIYRKKNEPEIHLQSNTASKSVSMSIPTSTIESTELDYWEKMKEGLKTVYDYSVECSSNELQHLATFASGLKAEKIRFLLTELKRDKQQFHLITQIEHENNFFEECFYSSFEKDDSGNKIVFKNTALSLTEKRKKYTKKELNVVFNECFATDFFQLIVGNLSTPQVTINLHQDKAFILKANLGDDQSQITFALAPKEATSDFQFRSDIFD